jgi:hypothetical protein
MILKSKSRMLPFAILVALVASGSSLYAQTGDPNASQQHPDTAETSAVETSPPQPQPPPNAVLLDRVVAVINGDVILQSDVLEEERFEQLQPFHARSRGGADQPALDRIINRTLILQQLKDLQKPLQVTDAALDTELTEVRKHLPVCGADKCVSDAGWNAVLTGYGFTAGQFRERWRVRMLVLAFIEQRFRAGVRISKPEIQQYYDKYLVPEFRKRNVTPPALAAVSPRIDEILLQQHVNELLQEWLNSLKDQGTVAILDPEYQQIASQLPQDDSTDPNAGGAQE